MTTTDGTHLQWLANHPTFTVRPWPIPTSCGRHPVRSEYVERFWLPILGPSALLALRSIDRAILTSVTRQAVVDLVEFGASLGIGTGTGRHTQTNRTLARLIDFDMARIVGDHLETVTTLPEVPTRKRRRIPPALLDELEAHEKASV